MTARRDMGTLDHRAGGIEPLSARDRALTGGSSSSTSTLMGSRFSSTCTIQKSAACSEGSFSVLLPAVATWIQENKYIDQ